MWEALEQTAWVRVLGNSGLAYVVVSVVHYLTMFWFIGSIAVVDLRIVGVAARRRSVTELADQLFPWAWIGLAFAVLSGFLMFAPFAGDWAPDPVFHIKLTLIVLGLGFAVVVQRGVPKWAQASRMPTTAKVIAITSLLLWILTILCASEIPGREGLG